jgi:N-acetylglucosamine-6-phosphate deacetylase
MSQLLLHNARVVSPRSIEHGGVLVRDGDIVQIFSGDDKPRGLSSSESIDLGGGYLAPGMIDIHIHGSAGVDVLDADRDALTRLSEFLLAEGVTGYFATLVPADERGYHAAIREITSYTQSQDQRPPHQRGARILGVHFEGPFVSHNRCGALQREHFQTYDGDARSLELFTGEPEKRDLSFARLMTLAPEVEGGLDLVRDLASSGVRVFIGHTQADPETLDLAAEAGARHITHFFNALDQLHHRKPGAVAWGLVRGDVTMDCIADFQHVHPLVLKMIYQAKGADRVALISDATLPTGLGDGEFTVWGVKIAVRSGLTSLVGGPAEGTIAGSVITMRQALKNTLSLGIPIEEAVMMASLVPAQAAGVEGERGSIQEGKRADLVAFDDDLKVNLVIVGGQPVFDRQ